MKAAVPRSSAARSSGSIASVTFSNSVMRWWLRSSRMAWPAGVSSSSVARRLCGATPRLISCVGQSVTEAACTRWREPEVNAHFGDQAGGAQSLKRLESAQWSHTDAFDRLLENDQVEREQSAGGVFELIGIPAGATHVIAARPGVAGRFHACTLARSH